MTATQRAVVAGLVSAGLATAVVHVARRAERPPPPPVDMGGVVRFLASDELEGRALGSPGEARAAQFIATTFEQLGLAPPTGATRFQPFDVVIDGKSVHSSGNVLATLDVGAAHTIVLGAHYDHLGHGPRHSRAPFEPAIHNGADDNASGVAVLLWLASRFAATEQKPAVNLVFVAFSGEEEGLYGASAFLDAGFPAPLCFFNFDMVGRLNATKPTVSLEGTQEYPAWKALLEAAPREAFALRTDDAVTPGSSDHVVFAAAGVPVLSFTTGLTDDYHRPSDDAERLDYRGMQAIAAYALELVQMAARHPEDFVVKPGVDSGGPSPAPLRH